MKLRLIFTHGAQVTILCIFLAAVIAFCVFWIDVFGFFGFSALIFFISLLLPGGGGGAYRGRWRGGGSGGRLGSFGAKRVPMFGAHHSAKSRSRATKAGW
jgi:hypothetical protein